MKTLSNKFQQLAVVTGIALSGIGGSGAITPVDALSFNFAYDPTMDARAIAGFQQAGALWSASFTDNVTVNIAIGFTDLSKSDPGTIGLAGSSRVVFSNYNDIYTALTNDRTSADDLAAVASLPNSSSVKRLLNDRRDTANNPISYLDNVSSVTMTTANVKALGLSNANLLAPGQSDASITFASNYNWDFARGTKIATNSYDFVGVAAHEIGHALGFVSGVDLLKDNRSNEPANKLSVTPLDLFRYSADSKAQNAIDFTLGNTAKYFSLDGGVTKIATFETGAGTYQASHWLDNNGLGILDPTAANGELLAISETDLRALDAIGWNRSPIANSLTASSNRSIDSSGANRLSASELATAVPEPANYLGTSICAAFGIGAIVKRHRSINDLKRE